MSAWPSVLVPKAGGYPIHHGPSMRDSQDNELQWFDWLFWLGSLLDYKLWQLAVISKTGGHLNVALMWLSLGMSKSIMALMRRQKWGAVRDIVPSGCWGCFITEWLGEWRHMSTAYNPAGEIKDILSDRAHLLLFGDQEDSVSFLVFFNILQFLGFSHQETKPR